MKKVILSLLLVAFVKHGHSQIRLNLNAAASPESAYMMKKKNSSGGLAKLSAAVAVSENLYLGVGHFTGINLRAAYDLGNKGQAFLGFNYSFPVSRSYSTDASALSSSTMPDYITVSYADKIHLNELHAGYRIFLGSENTGNFGFYLHAGIGIVFASETITFDPFDRGLYTTGLDEGKQSFVGFVINAGCGLQFKAGPGFVYFEPRFSLPANKVNNEYVENPIPFSVGAVLGYRIPFGSN